jgi:hypothetical protein
VISGVRELMALVDADMSPENAPDVMPLDRLQRALDEAGRLLAELKPRSVRHFRTAQSHAILAGAVTLSRARSCSSSMDSRVVKRRMRS